MRKVDKLTPEMVVFIMEHMDEIDTSRPYVLVQLSDHVSGYSDTLSIITTDHLMKRVGWSSGACGIILDPETWIGRYDSGVPVHIVEFRL